MTDPGLYDKVMRALSEPRYLTNFVKKEDGPYLSRVRADLRKARRFIVTPELMKEATRRSLLASHEDLLSWLGEARLPYETCWFEFDEQERWRAALEFASDYSQEVIQGSAEESPRWLGFLINDRAGAVTIEEFTSGGPASRNPREVGNWLLSWVYDVSGYLPASFHEPRMGAILDYAFGMVFKSSEGKRHVINMTEFIDTVTNPAHTRGNREKMIAAHAMTQKDGRAADQLRMKMGVVVSRLGHLIVGGDPKVKMEDRFKEVLTESAGTMRWWLALMGLIHTRRTTYAMPGASREATGVEKPYMSERSDVIELPKEGPTVIGLGTPGKGGWKNREHEVMGHWCETRVRGLRHPHVWNQTDAEGEKFACDCGAKKWWRRPGLRGDASIGFVKKTYQLEKRTK